MTPNTVALKSDLKNLRRKIARKEARVARVKAQVARLKAKVAQNDAWVHQCAINVVTEWSLYTVSPELEAVAPRTFKKESFPQIFRIALEKPSEQFPQEVEILRHALRLQDADEAEQREFCAALAFWLDDDEHIRVKFAPLVVN